MHHAGKYSQQSSIIWQVWLNGWVFVCEQSGGGFESSCSQLFMYFVMHQESGTWMLRDFLKNQVQ